MLESILISDEEMSHLPGGAAGFLAYENLCRNKLNNVLNRSDINDDTMDIRLSYLVNVINAASFYEVSDLQDMELDISENFDYSTARAIARRIDREVSKLRFAAMEESRLNVILSEGQRSKIGHLIIQLRQRVSENAELDEIKKAKINKKIDELSSMFIAGAKPNIQATMIVVASIFTAISQAEAAIIKLPDVVTAVLEVFGHAREEAKQKFLQPEERKLIEHHTTSEAGLQMVSDLDDEIPF